jgi:hypothetical protein
MHAVLCVLIDGVLHVQLIRVDRVFTTIIEDEFLAISAASATKA